MLKSSAYNAGISNFPELVQCSENSQESIFFMNIHDLDQGVYKQKALLIHRCWACTLQSKIPLGPPQVEKKAENFPSTFSFTDLFQFNAWANKRWKIFARSPVLSANRTFIRIKRKPYFDRRARKQEWRRGSCRQQSPKCTQRTFSNSQKPEEEGENGRRKWISAIVIDLVCYWLFLGWV